MRHNRKYPKLGAEPEDVCRISPSILYSGDILSDMAVGDTLAGVLPDRIDLLLQRQPINLESLVYRGLS
jgi:hypothetical protein